MVLATQNGQLVMVAVDTIPLQVAAESGIVVDGTVSAMAMTGSGSGGDPQTPREGAMPCRERGVTRERLSAVAIKREGS
jgi:hypothetical protein